MSDVLSRVQILLDANTARFEQSMRNAQTTASNTFGKIVEGAKTMAPAVAAGGAIAVGAIAAMTKEYIDAASEVTKFAEISGSSTTEFQKMAVGAKTLGFESEQLSDIYKDFNEKLGEFTTLGSGGAVDFFEKIAIKTEGGAAGARKLALEMQNLSGPQALQLYVDKAEQAGVTSQQMSFYLESMASDTTKLLPLLRNGGEGFKFWADEAERAGVIMDESTIKKAGELNVQMDLLNLRVKGAKNQFIEGFIPSLTSVSGALSGAKTKTDLFSDAGETLGGVLSGVAAIALGVYASVKLVTNAVAGLAVDAVNAKKLVDSASDAGTWADRLPGVKLAKTAIFGATLAKAETSATSMAVEDNSKIIADVGTMITGLFDRTQNAAIKAMAEARNGVKGLNDGSKEWEDKQNEAAKAVSGVNKALQEQNRLLEQQKRDREQISKAYASDFQNMTWDEKEQQDLVKSANFSATEQTKYLDLIQKRFNAESAEYFKALNLEFNKYKWSEEKKLEYAYQMDREIAENDVKIADEVRETKLKFLDEQYAYQKKQLEFSQAKELLQTKQKWMSAAEYAQQYYALIREEILNTPEYSPEMKNNLIKEANFNQGLGENSERENVWDDYKSMMDLEESPYQQDMNLLAEARAQMLITEEEYQRDRLALQVGYGDEYLGALSGMFGAILGESSSTYQALFMAQKMFALSQAGMNIYKAASDAFANEPGTVWQKMGAAAMATLEGGTFVAMIEAATPIAHGGLDYVPEETTYLLDEGERVLSPRQNSDLTNYLANSENSKGGGDVNIDVQVTDSGVTAQSNQEDKKQLGQMIGNAVRAVIMQEKRQGGLLSK